MDTNERPTLTRQEQDALKVRTLKAIRERPTRPIIREETPEEKEAFLQVKQKITILIAGKIQASITAPVPMPSDMLIAILQNWEKMAADGSDKFFERLDSEVDSNRSERRGS